MMILKYILRQHGNSGGDKPLGVVGVPMEFAIPKGAIVLDAAIQKGWNICVWVLIPDTAQTQIERRAFVYFATGQAFSSDYTLNFIRTVVDVNNEVWHVFEEVRPQEDDSGCNTHILQDMRLIDDLDGAESEQL